MTRNTNDEDDDEEGAEANEDEAEVRDSPPSESPRRSPRLCFLHSSPLITPLSPRISPPRSRARTPGL